MTIPELPEFQDIDLSMKEAVDSYIVKQPPEASEYTFANLFAFKKTYNFKLSILDDSLIILTEDPVSVFCPVGGYPDLDRIFEYMRDRSSEPHMERVTENFVHQSLVGSNKYIAEEERLHFDYVYDVRELMELKGRKFHDKKNKVNQFRNANSYEYIPLNPDLIRKCIEFEDYWCETRECEKHAGLKGEKCAILAMLNNFEQLDLKGGAIVMDDKVAALTIGEQYLADTFVIHVEKANSEIQGLYQVMNQEFLMHEADDCRYVNREQDLGVEGLRASKMSYNPVRFIRKYRVREAAS
jgi:hypothetical protein